MVVVLIVQQALLIASTAAPKPGDSFFFKMCLMSRKTQCLLFSILRAAFLVGRTSMRNVLFCSFSMCIFVNLNQNSRQQMFEFSGLTFVFCYISILKRRKSLGKSPSFSLTKYNTAARVHTHTPHIETIDGVCNLKFYEIFLWF